MKEEAEKCKVCGMALNDETRCTCMPDTCAMCCTCPPDCQCGCVEKAKKMK